MSEWQDIETAPKDGRMIIIFLPLDDSGKFHVGAYKYAGNGGWFNDSNHFVLNPTHWMPLLKLPEANG